MADLAGTGVAADVLISADDLHRLLATPAADGRGSLDARRPLLLDVRWVLGDPHGHEHYLERRIPGSLYVDLNQDLAAPAVAREGRHPLPSPEAFQATARGWGLHKGQDVVVLDDNGGLAAARAWWLLRWAGHEQVRVLDGGLGAWVAAGYAVDGAQDPIPAPEPGDVELGSGRLPTLDIDAAAAFPQQGVLLDARAGERFRGETEPVDPRAGHIPGALSAPTGENLQKDGRFKTPEELRARFAALGVSRDGGGSGSESGSGSGSGSAGSDVATGPVAAYCGSGVTAAHEVLALAVVGVPAALYPGSWSQWSNHPDRPVATGPEA
jgi:thiosulfate/3-mercaptopyruvate sulfurtransferase